MPSKTKARAATAEDVPMEDAPPSAQPGAEDQDMAEGEGQQEEEEEEDEDEEEQEETRVRILPGSTETAASFEFKKEGHTMGNALRYIIMKNPGVEFCAYSIPHPSEDKMNLRIQTYEGTTAMAALEKGLRDVEDLCDVVAEEFWTQRNEFDKTDGPRRAAAAEARERLEHEKAVASGRA